MKLTIEDLRGTWRAQIDHRSEFADTLEELLLKLVPSAPPDAVWSAAEVLGAILGAEVVELESSPQLTPDEWSEMRDLFLESFGDGFDTPFADDHQPVDEQIDGLTEAVQEYTDPDVYPRGV